MTWSQAALDEAVRAANKPSRVSHPETVYFAEKDLKWLRRKWAVIRDAQQQADRAQQKYLRVSAEIIDYMDRSGITDMVARAKTKSESLTLQDCISTVTFYRNEAATHIADVQLFLRMREMRLL